jgi:hypothetical protein
MTPIITLVANTTKDTLNLPAGNLTHGKDYPCLGIASHRQSGTLYTVINDVGIKMQYHESWFDPIN